MPTNNVPPSRDPSLYFVMVSIVYLTLGGVLGLLMIFGWLLGPAAGI